MHLHSIIWIVRFLSHYNIVVGQQTGSAVLTQANRYRSC